MSVERKITFLGAVLEAQQEEMSRDERVVLLGQDVRSNVYGATGRLLERFGPKRVRDVPMSEIALVGAGVGAALTGLRPIIDLTVASFMYSAMDQFINQAGKMRYMFGGQCEVPVVYRAALYYQRGNAAHHSDRPYPLFMHSPGLKVLVPGSPADMKGLLKAAIRDPDPVVVFEDSTLWGRRNREVVPEGDVTVPIGSARTVRRGKDATIVAIGGGVRIGKQVVEEMLARDGLDVELIDPRTLAPMDWETIIESVARTGRLVIVDPANRTCSAASEISAMVTERCWASLKAPPRRVTAADIPIPFAPTLEGWAYPTAERVSAAVRAVCHGEPELASHDWPKV